MRNHKVVLTRSLAGVPDAGDFQVVEEPLPEPRDGELLIRHLYLSLDPYQRSAIAGSDEKCAIVIREFGFRACVNYHREGFLDALRTALPDGADIYHDNVGGQLLADAFSVLKINGTVILCGLMERYNDPAKSKPLDLALPIMKRAVMKGLVVSDFEHRRPVFEAAVAGGIQAGQIHYREDRAIGIGQTGAHFARLMRGENVGKALVVLGSEAAQQT